jgi:hypothetical protein
MSAATAEGDSVRFPLVLGPYETKVVVVGPLPGVVAAPEPSLASGTTLAELEMGAPSSAGPATYRKQFTASAAPAGKRLFLEIAGVHDYARVKLNGKELEAHAWQPYRWEVTSTLKAGTNDLEIQVNAAEAAGRKLPRERRVPECWHTPSGAVLAREDKGQAKACPTKVGHALACPNHKELRACPGQVVRPLSLPELHPTRMSVSVIVIPAHQGNHTWHDSQDSKS